MLGKANNPASECIFPCTELKSESNQKENISSKNIVEEQEDAAVMQDAQANSSTPIKAIPSPQGNPLPTIPSGTHDIVPLSSHRISALNMVDDLLKKFEASLSALLSFYFDCYCIIGSG